MQDPKDLLDTNVETGHLKSIRESGSGMLWKQSNSRYEFELVAGDESIANLNFIQSESGILANAECSEGKWTFERQGLLHPYVAIGDSSETGLRMGLNLAGQGLLNLPDGSSYTWESSNFMHSRWAFFDSEGRKLVEFIPQGKLLKTGAMVHVERSADQKDLSLLILLGWYLMTLRLQDMSL